IYLASGEEILSWSHGEVTKPETINYRTFKSERDGLFDERIFGPSKNYECYCGKYKGIRYKGVICDKCGVEVTHSRVRRERMGHINLAAPVAHIWYFKGAPSKLSLLLDISPKSLSSIIYFAQYVVLEVDNTKKAGNLEQLSVALSESQDKLRDKTKLAIEETRDFLTAQKKKLKEKVSNKETLELKIQEAELKAKQQVANLKSQLDEQLEQTAEIYSTITKMIKKIKKGTILSEDEYIKIMDYDAASHLRVGMGAESILELVKELDLDELVEQLREDCEITKGARKVKIIKRLRVVEGLRKAEINAAWMFLTVLPVIPPDLRPMVQLSGGRFATSDLNDLYRRVINRNNRLKHLIDLGAPDIILRNEKRMLQEAVDSLIDQSNTKRRRRQRQLRSLSDMLKGKQGRFRRNLLGKRVDYSGRSVIVVGPELRLNQCGLPKDMALEMYKPYVLRELILNGIAPNVKSARHLIDRREPEVYDVLERVTENHPVILNRAPTLHKLGMQAFFPILVEGKAIRLHPCVCAGYNADFDGDQMAVHLPLTKEAQQEQLDLLMSTQNLLKPANSEPVTVPNKEMAMGVYYHTIMNEKLEDYPSIFANIDEAQHVHQIGLIDLQQPIKVRLVIDGKSEIVRTTVGRIEFNELLSAQFSFINEAVTAKKIKELVTQAIETQPREQITHLIDNIKDIGFEAATLSGISVSVADCEMIGEKDLIIEEANKKVEKIQENYQEGLITNDERKKLTYTVWMDTTEEVANKTWNSYDERNAVKVIIDSGGTRASKDQVKQLAAMRGLVVDPLGNIVEMPTKSNFRQGLSIFEYVTSARGSRKGLTDSALKTADAGYLTRRLVDVAHDVIIRQEDCGTKEGLEITKDTRKNSFTDRITGRIAIKDIKAGAKIIAKAGEVITQQLAENISATAKIQSVLVRSPLTCEATKGLCANCYGWDFATRKLVEIGVPVGVVAAQSIGEPGTQLTMRVKHSGGIVGLDVTQGLPRVEEIFEARNPKSQALVSELTGRVKIDEGEEEIVITVVTTSAPKEEVSYKVNLNTTLTVENGDLIAAGEKLTVGSVNLGELLQIRGLLFAQQHVVTQVQYVYESQGITIHDKHFETIARKMGDKVRIEKPGDTEFLTGEVIERSQLIEGNDDIMAAGGEPASAKVMLLGITRSALYTHSWLSAASFQHTKSVLTNAACAGAIDYLEGLKENVIIGRLIPTSLERAQIDV
ncbi:DNA-directed RNA polymerase subunit beta', partial [Patescibacteria group bacterium]|nr:DNA-directed RNA polymerase subunit beta' [Patescibacteria group bacterium]